MKFSSKTRYGIRTMLEIALDTENKGVYQKDIAINQEISVKYLDSIIHSLKVAGLIKNARGKKSGYVLTRPATDITIYDIHCAFEPGIHIVDCLAPNNQCVRNNRCSVKNFWQGLNWLISDYMVKNTLNEIVKLERTSRIRSIIEKRELHSHNQKIENMKKKVLLIDDDQDLVRSFEVIIKNWNFDVFTASNGKEGMSMLLKEKPDLLVLDIMMDSNLEGYNLLHSIKAKPEFREMPVIVLTGMIDELDVNLASGVEDEKLFPKVVFQHKPIDPLVLLEMIHEMI